MVNFKFIFFIIFFISLAHGDWSIIIESSNTKDEGIAGFNNDGEITIFSNSYFLKGSPKIKIIKLNNFGQIKSENFLNELGIGFKAEAISIINARKGFQLVGNLLFLNTWPYILFSKLDNMGRITQTETIRCELDEQAHDIIQGTNGNYYIAGNRWDFNSISKLISYLYIINVDQNGKRNNENVFSLGECSNLACKELIISPLGDLFILVDVDIDKDKSFNPSLPHCV